MRVGVAIDHGLSDINECPPMAGLRFLPWRSWCRCRFNAISSAVYSRSVWISGGKEFK